MPCAESQDSTAGRCIGRPTIPTFCSTSFLHNVPFMHPQSYHKSWTNLQHRKWWAQAAEHIAFLKFGGCIRLRVKLRRASQPFACCGWMGAHVWSAAAPVAPQVDYTPTPSERSSLQPGPPRRRRMSNHVPVPTTSKPARTRPTTAPGQSGSAHDGIYCGNPRIAHISVCLALHLYGLYWKGSSPAVTPVYSLMSNSPPVGGEVGGISVPCG